MSRPNMSMSGVVSAARLMAEGIRSHEEQLKRLAVGSEQADKIENLIESVLSHNAEQEFMKATLKKKTEQIRNELKDLQRMMAESRKIIKICVEKNDWVAFGISDKQ